MVNNCLFLENAAVATAAGAFAFGGAISDESDLKVFNSIFKKNKAIATRFGGGGAIVSFFEDVLVLNSVFELNEASNEGGAAQLFSIVTSVAWYNNKELLFGNDADADEDCDGGAVGSNPPACFSVGENFSMLHLKGVQRSSRVVI